MRGAPASGWAVLGLSRRAPVELTGVTPVLADLTDAAALAAALAGTAPTHVFITAWARQATEAENIEVNGGMVRDVLAAVRPAGSVRHVALLTGLKHYLGPFEAYGAGNVPDTPFHEDEARLPYPNFYYAQEDELLEAAERDGFTWSVHRAHTVIGYAVGNAMNMGQTLAAQAAVCRETGRPFVFPGSETQWNGADRHDRRRDAGRADALGGHHARRRRQPAFNIANGDVFRWRWMWPRLAEGLGVEPVGFEGARAPWRSRWRGRSRCGPSWPHASRAARSTTSTRVASWWHTDGDLGRDMECLTDMTRSRAAGFTGLPLHPGLLPRPVRAAGPRGRRARAVATGRHAAGLTRPRPRSGTQASGGLEGEQALLGGEPTGVPGQRARGGHHPVAGQHHAQRVGAEGRAHRPGRAGSPDPPGQRAVRRALAVGRRSRAAR